MEVSIRELKANLSAVVRSVEAGETATITAHRKAIAKLVPMPSTAESDSLDARLIACGLMSSLPKSGGLVRRPGPKWPPEMPTLSQAVIEDRGPW